MLPPGLLLKLRSAKRRRKPTKRPTRAPSSDRMERRSGLPFPTSPPLSSTPRFHPPAAVEADGPLVVAGTVVVGHTVTLPLLTRLPLGRHLTAQSRHLESEDGRRLAVDVLLPSLRSQDGLPAQTVLRLMHGKPLRHPSEAVQLATVKTTLLESR